MDKVVHTVLICYENPEQTLTRWKRDILPGLDFLRCKTCVTVIDNSQSESQLLKDFFKWDYLWQQGRNLMYGPSLNAAVPRLPSDYILYACTRHGKMFDPSWVKELLIPFEQDPLVGMSGHLRGSNSPEGVAHAGGPHCQWVKSRFRFEQPDGQGYVPEHVQGGVFLARTDLMLKYPYPEDFPHLYTDHMITWMMLKGGYKVANVPTILSVWRDKVEDPRGYKYVHSENFT